MDGLMLKPFNDWLESDDGDPWLVEGLVTDNGTTWFASRGIGKSLLTVDLAAALVKGETEWLGRKIRTGGGPVAFLVSDPRAERETSRRLSAMGAPEGSVVVGRLRRGPEPVEWWQGLAQALKGYRLVVIDSGTNIVHGIVELEHVNPLFDGLNELVAADIPVLLVHHMRSDGTKSAGNYTWESWPRWWMYMRKDRADSPYRTLSFEGNEVTDLPTTVVDRPGDLGGSDPWEDAESCQHSGSTLMGCVNAW